MNASKPAFESANERFVAKNINPQPKRKDPKNP